MSERPRVFVSHSAKEPDTLARLRDVVETLEQSGFQAIVDYERLANGDQWWDALGPEIRGAHAVIVLLSAAALDSGPVFREVVVTMEDPVDNRGLNRLFVLRMPGVRSADIKSSKLGALGLHEIHADTATDADAIRQAVPRFLQAHYEAYRDNPVEELEAHLRARLQGLGTSVLEAAARVLGIDPEVSRGAVLINRLARRLLTFTGDAVTGVQSVRLFLEKAPPTGVHASLLVDLLLSAAALPESMRTEVAGALRPRDRQALGVAVAEPQTGLLYLRRACTQWVPWFTYSAGSVASDEHLDRLVADVRAQLVENLGFLDDPSDTELLAELDEYERVSGPMSVLVPASPDPQLVRQLRGRFPRLLFLFVAGSDHPDTPVPGIRWVRPALPRETERKVLRARLQLKIRHQLSS